MKLENGVLNLWRMLLRMISAYLGDVLAINCSTIDE